MTRRGRPRKQHEESGGAPGSLLADSIPAGIAGDGMAKEIAVIAPAALLAPSPAPDLVAVDLTAQIGLLWPQDGRRHYYGPGVAHLPFVIAESLRRATHRLVAQ